MQTSHGSKRVFSRCNAATLTVLDESEQKIRPLLLFTFKQRIGFRFFRNSPKQRKRKDDLKE
ncbi:hypothetical protein LEP1GSC082_4038 [Leptospira kirschneri str. H2]|uniref:Uncharacterized protein n=2 Tax=Leptospira kirschneri TaxID=29507 RepID=A0A0E2B2L8_9LEPT|nr:hypothetical protein LEP1GSC081_0644 [Leptospira kirschneri str. H1]EKO61639.1 hypothetical protein LEP1GSC082_4038 [Leptospira kirschneri str. H2]EMK21748.1 hypothetical protein LEP1GSC008_3287 [Leptospira kirschneri serovar Bulgarica str. Nikolaevo]